MANLTLKIDDALLRDAKVLAARRGTSVSRLAAEQLEELVRQDKKYETARRRALRRLEEGYDLGWQPPASRDDLYERRTGEKLSQNVAQPSRRSRLRGV